jgi:phage gp45-like
MNEPIKQIAAKVRNLFVTGDFQKRYDDGKIQIKTLAGRALEKKEAFPYGFKAKAKKGKVFVFCPGGSFGGFEVFPVLAAEDITPPKLEEGDSALYTESGGWVVAREDGTVELFGKDLGGIVKADELKAQLDKLTARVDGIMNALKTSATAAMDGGATYKGQIAAALSALTVKEDFSDLASDKVFHGTGKK